jgi:hypothetical protein
MTTVKIDRVEITREDRGDEPVFILVRPYWSGVDRKDGTGYSLPDTPNGQRLAERLKRCMESMAMFPNARAATDNAGKTYATCDGYHVVGRTMNADLKRLGF